MSRRLLCGLLCVVAALAPGTSSARAGSFDVLAEVNQFIELVNDEERFHPDAAIVIMEGIFETIFAIAPEDIDLAAFDADPMAVVNRLFDATLALDRRMAESHHRGAYSAELADAKRYAIRALRRVREWAQRRARKLDALPATLPPIPALHAIPSVPDYAWVCAQDEPQITDLPRTFFLANAWPEAVCSTITRATKRFQSFCHFTVGHVTDRELKIGGTTYPAGSILAIEAVADRGVVIWPLENHFLGSTRRGTTRETLFIVADPSLQAAVDDAAEQFAEHVIRAINRGSPMGYDFSMGTAGTANSEEGASGGESKSPLEGEYHFCSGIGAAIGEKARAPLFTHLSRFMPPGRRPDLLELWGIDRDMPVAAPGDIDKSVTLRRVAEGVRLDSVGELHLMHATLSSLVEWARHDRYGVHVPGWLKGTMQAVVGATNLFPWASSRKTSRRQ